MASTPPTEKVLKFNMTFHNSTKKYIFSKHQNKAESKFLDDSEVLSSDFSDLRTSADSVTSTVSMASVASMTFTASFHQKTFNLKKNIYFWWLVTFYQGMSCDPFSGRTHAHRTPRFTTAHTRVRTLILKWSHTAPAHRTCIHNSNLNSI